MAKPLVVWGPYADQDPKDFIAKCAQHGVTRVIPGGGSQALTEAGRAKGIEVFPYFNHTAFPGHGRLNVRRNWSCEWVLPSVDSPQAREVLDKHRPIWRTGPPELTTSDYAKAHPEFRSYTRDKRETLNLGERLYLSLAFPEVRAHQIAQVVSSFEKTGGDGAQVEWVLGDEDEKGVVTYGYEDRLVGEFQQKHSRNPMQLPNDDPAWMQFRADYVTLYLKELRQALKAKAPRAPFSTTIIAGEPQHYIKVLQDWPAWVEQKLIDEFYIWFRTTTDMKAVERQTRHAADVIKGRVPVIAELSCYHPGSFQDPKLMLEAARRARASGADAVGIYGSHPIEQLNFWPVLDQMAKL